MSSFNDDHMTWATAYDLINKEISRLQSMSTTIEQQRYGEAVLLKEVAFLSAKMVATVRKILTYLKHVEHMDLGRRENLQRGVMTCYLVECVQVWTVYGLPCTTRDAEFLYLSRRLTELLHRDDLPTPYYCRDSNPLLLGLLYHIRWVVLGQHAQRPNLVLPYQGNEGRSDTAAWMYRALCNLTGGDSLNRCFPYAFLYGTFSDITVRTQIGLNRRRLEIYLNADVWQLLLRHKRTLLVEDSVDFPDFGVRAPDLDWHALQITCRLLNLRQQQQRTRQVGENVDERHEVHFSAREVFAWRTAVPPRSQTMPRRPQQASHCSCELRGVRQDGGYMSMTVARSTQIPHQSHVRSPAPVRMTDLRVLATRNARRDRRRRDEDRNTTDGSSSG